MHGLPRYKLLHFIARAFVRAAYKDVSVSTLRMWQPVGNERQLRWAGGW